MSLTEAQALDAADPLAGYRDRFVLPEGVIYLDGNSLGPLPHATVAAGADMLTRAWGERLIRSWNEGWIDAPQRVGAMILRNAAGETACGVAADRDPPAARRAQSSSCDRCLFRRGDRAAKDRARFHSHCRGNRCR